MHTIFEKLKLIYVRFLIIAICIIGGYTFLHWLLFIRFQLFTINEDVLKIWIPFALPWIPLWIWLLPRIKLLKLKQKKGNLYALFILIACFAITIPTIVAQSYLIKATGKLTSLDKISLIEKLEPTKYYNLKNFYFDKNKTVIYNAEHVLGKGYDGILYHTCFLIPILDKISDTAKSECIAWLCFEYKQSADNSVTDDEKDKVYKEFFKESFKDFKSKNILNFIYLERPEYNVYNQDFYKAIQKNKKCYSVNPVILFPINEPFGKRTGNLLIWVFVAFANFCIIWLIMILIPKFDLENLLKFKKGKPDNINEAKVMLFFFLPRKDFFITPIIIDLNVLIFIIMMFAGLGFISFRSEDLLAWGANFKPYTINGQWWRLLTSTFLHGGMMHIAANMIGLLFIGILLEPRLGRLRLVLIYLTTGILASATSLWWYDATVSVGASGAIFGLYGVFLAFLLTKVYPKDFTKSLLWSILIFIGYNLLMGFTGGIDNAAHIGGLVSGFIIGLILSQKLKIEAEDDPAHN